MNACPNREAERSERHGQGRVKCCDPRRTVEATVLTPEVGGEGSGADQPSSEPPRDTEMRGSCSSGECTERQAGETVYGPYEKDGPEPAARAKWVHVCGPTDRAQAAAHTLSDHSAILP